MAFSMDGCGSQINSADSNATLEINQDIEETGDVAAQSIDEISRDAENQNKTEPAEMITIRYDEFYGDGTPSIYAGKWASGRFIF